MVTLPEGLYVNSGNWLSGGSYVEITKTAASTDNRAACDPDKLVSYLAGNPQASEAWVHALNSDRALSWSGGSRVEIQQIPSYLHELTPHLLADDLRVTNYHFTNGAALAVQSVLRKGTAVLVDAKGIARVRCACGNPLTPMVQLKVPPIYRGTPWPISDPKRVLATQRELLRPISQCHPPLTLIWIRSRGRAHLYGRPSRRIRISPTALMSHRTQADPAPMGCRSTTRMVLRDSLSRTPGTGPQDQRA